MTNIDKSTDRAESMSICFYHNIDVKYTDCLNDVWELKKSIAWHVDARSIVCTVMDNGKLAVGQSDCNITASCGENKVNLTFLCDLNGFLSQFLCF